MPSMEEMEIPLLGFSDMAGLYGARCLQAGTLRNTEKFTIMLSAVIGKVCILCSSTSSGGSSVKLAHLLEISAVQNTYLGSRNTINAV